MVKPTPAETENVIETETFTIAGHSWTVRLARDAFDGLHFELQKIGTESVTVFASLEIVNLEHPNDRIIFGTYRSERMLLTRFSDHYLGLNLGERKTLGHVPLPRIQKEDLGYLRDGCIAIKLKLVVPEGSSFTASDLRNIASGSEIFVKMLQMNSGFQKKSNSDIWTNGY